MNTDDILRHCDCGICGHMNEAECIEHECHCCYNFHIRARNDYNDMVKTDIIEEKQRFQHVNKH